MHSEIDNYFIYKMGCSNSKAEEPVALNGSAMILDFDDYACEKFGVSLVTQQKVKESIHLLTLDANPQAKAP